MSQRSGACRIPLFWLVIAMVLFAGCGKEITKPKDGGGEGGRAATYFPLYVGDETRYRLLHPAYDSIGTTSFAIISTFTTPTFTGLVAVDSSLAGIDTLWLTVHADTVFSLPPRANYANRRPIVRNHDQTDFSWPLYSVGTPGMIDRYTVVFHQRPQSETYYPTRGQLFSNCGRTDLLAIYEQSGDTVILGSEYFAPDIGRVSSTFRPFVESTQYAREIIR